jgi:hypothetical protein
MTFLDEEIIASIFKVKMQAEQVVSKQNTFLKIERRLVR